MTISQLRNQVNALMRKFTVQLAVHKLRPLASEYCDQWRELVAKKEPPPNPNRLFDKIPGKDSLRHKLTAILNYLDNCRWGPPPPPSQRNPAPHLPQRRQAPHRPGAPPPRILLTPAGTPHGRQWAAMGGKSQKIPPAHRPLHRRRPLTPESGQSSEIGGKSQKIPPISCQLKRHSDNPFAVVLPAPPPVLRPPPKVV